MGATSATALPGSRPCMEVSRRFTRNIFSSWLGFCVQIGVMVVLTPLILNALGGRGFGVWALLSALTGYYGLLDAGARASITRVVTRYLALGDIRQMNRVASAGLAALLGCSAVLLVATVLCAALGPAVFRVPDDVAREFRWSVLVVGGSMALQYCFFVHSASIGARQRHDLAMATHILTQIVYGCGVPLVLAAGGGLIGLTLWLSVMNLLAYALHWPIARRVVPELSLSLRLVDRAGLREFAHFGVWQFLVNLSQQIIGCSDAIVISVTMSTTAVAPFYLANRITRCFIRFFMPVGAVLFPMLTHFEALGDRKRVCRLFLRGSRLMWILSVGLGAIAAYWAGDFFALWVGERQAGFEGRVSDLFSVLIVAAAVTAPQQIALPVLLAFARQRGAALLFLAEAMANIGLSLALASEFGLMGIAWGTCLPALLFQGFVHPLFTCRLLEVRLATYAREVLMRPMLFGAVLAILASVGPRFAVDSWGTFAFAAACSGLVVLAVALAIGLGRADREQLLRRLHSFKAAAAN